MDVAENETHHLDDLLRFRGPIEGDATKVTDLLGLMDEFDAAFEIVRPKRVKK